MTELVLTAWLTPWRAATAFTARVWAWVWFGVPLTVSGT